ncbi:MAG TPA: prolipoprotein diacylglyceryl transferase family protein, partial [Candidatus Dormibacteraeota bacterium]|nr:prolipoprotein diacylglyceryl transferase family protein [Candidatus Dormibacteraeota bacterium]
MPAAVVTFEFDPIVRIAGLAVRWESIGIAGSILLALLAAALLARSVPVDSEGRRLHADDLLSIAVGAVPGAIVGGRIGYALVHLDYYGGHAAVLFDPTQGGFQLGLAVVGGMLTGAYVARVVDAPVGRWAHTAAIPLLILLGSGKAAMAWGGSGQGAISSAPWATSYAGAGPWGSVAPDLPAQPAQLYESGVALGIAVL